MRELRVGCRGRGGGHVGMVVCGRVLSPLTSLAMGAQAAPGKGTTVNYRLSERLLAACSQRGSMLVLRETGGAHAQRHVELE